MFKKFFTWLIMLPVTMLFSQCAIEDDIPYPFVESSITVFEVEGQTNEFGSGFSSAKINNDAHTVQLYVNNSIDLSKVCIKRLEVSNDATIAIDKSVCQQPDRFPIHSFKETPDASATTVDFTSPVKFRLTTYQDYDWTVTVSYPTAAPILDVQLPNSSFDDWCSSGADNKKLWMPWKEGETGFWDTGNRGATTVGASNSTGVTEDGRTFANLQSKYIVVKFAAGNIFTGEYLATEGTNGVLSFGREFTASPKKLQFDYKFKSSTINKGGAWNDAYGRYVNKTMFTNLKGQPDSCQIYIALFDDYIDDADREANTYEGKVYPWVIRTRAADIQLFDPKSPRVIAYGQMTQGNDVTEWTTQQITLKYNDQRTPKYIMIVASSSKYGDYFVGGDQTLLQLDNLKLIYE